MEYVKCIGFLENNAEVQVCGLVQNPDSLRACVLNARYYPNGHLLDAVFGILASPAWKVIQHGLELLKKSVIW
jgi:hypothetical protein